MSTSPPSSSGYDPSVESIQRRVPVHDSEGDSRPESTDDDDDMDFEPASEGIDDDSLLDELGEVIFHGGHSDCLPSQFKPRLTFCLSRRRRELERS